MKKNSKQKSGKGILIVALLTVLALAAGITSIFLLSQNRTLSQIFGGDSNVYESARLDQICMNGEFIGDKISDDARSQHAEDADFQYMYNGVAYWVDEDSRITGLGFYTLTDEAGNLLIDIKESNIRYQGDRLETISDFEETFGLATIEKRKDGIDIYRYHQGDYHLEIVVQRGERSCSGCFLLPWCSAPLFFCIYATHLRESIWIR